MVQEKNKFFFGFWAQIVQGKKAIVWAFGYKIAQSCTCSEIFLKMF